MNALAGPYTPCKISSVSVARAQFAVLKSTSLSRLSSGTPLSISLSSGFLTEFLPAWHWADTLNWLHAAEVHFKETNICFCPLKVLVNDTLDADGLLFSLPYAPSDPLVILLQPTNRWKYQLCKITQASAISLAAAVIHFARGTAFPEHHAHLASCPDSSLPDRQERAERTASHLEMSRGRGQKFSHNSFQRWMLQAL